MDSQFRDSLETQSPLSDSVGFLQTLDGLSSSNSPTQTLDDLGNSILVPSQSSLDNSWNMEYLSADDHVDSAFLPDVEPPKDEKAEDDLLLSSSVHTFSTYSTSHWAEPWNSARDTKSLDSHWSEPWPVAVDTKCLASDSGWSEWPSARETNKPSVFDWSWTESWSSNSEIEMETKQYVSVLPACIAEDNPSMVGAGLANLGNTCFLNAVLQCVTHTVLLVHGLLSSKHAMPCYRNSDGFCVICALRDHIELSLDSMGRVVSPWKLVDNLSYFSSSFRRFQQEDAHEFLQCFLDRLDNCCYELKKQDTTLPVKDDNIVKQIFGGRLVSKLRCCNCCHRSDTYEPLIDLSLEIEDVGTLSAALESFTNVEKIEDPETKFTCEKCKEEVSIEKQLMLDQVPSVIAFHLKRFKNDGSYVERIDKYVEFPLELDLQPYINGSQSNNVDVKYDLYAFLVHIGFSYTSGHYYCFIRPAPDAWYMFDDSKVTRVGEEFVLSQEAYILFYAKRGTPWFSSFIETHKAFTDPSILNTSPKSVLDNMDHVCTSSPSAVNETSETSDRICVESSDGFISDMVEASEAEDDLNMAISSDENSHKVENIYSLSVLEEKKCNQEFGEVQRKSHVNPHTPPRSPSPEIYKEDLPDQVTYKRKLNKDLEDSERKQAFRLIESMPGSRDTKLLAALRVFSSEGSLDKKSRRMELSPNREKSSVSCCRNHSLNSAMHALAARSFR